MADALDLRQLDEDLDVPLERGAFEWRYRHVSGMKREQHQHRHRQVDEDEQRCHDQRRLMMMVRTLFEGGAKLDHRNIFGDTPYSIASAPRYCGPDHPATKAIAAPCFLGFKPLGDRCRASYQIKRASRI